MINKTHNRLNISYHHKYVAQGYTKVGNGKDLDQCTEEKGQTRGCHGNREETKHVDEKFVCSSFKTWKVNTP